MDLGIKQTVEKGGGNTLIYTALLGAIVSQAVPNLGDAFFFHYQEKNTDKLNSGEITPKQFWVRDALAYYGFSAAWYAVLLTSIMAIGGTYRTNARILLAALGGSVVIGVVAKNIQKDTLQQKQKNKVS